MFIDHTVYRKVFQNYIRNGTPIERSLKGSQDEFNDPTDIEKLQRRLENEDARDVDILDPTRIREMIYENIQRPLDIYIRGRAGLPRPGSEQLGIITGTPYSITDTWSGTLQGKIYLDASRSAFV